jgi:hypothetical protein
MSTASDAAARARAEMRALEVPEPSGWDAGDGVVVLTCEELAALRDWCFGTNIRALIVAAVQGWARRVPPAHRKRRIIDWLIEREAKVWEQVEREVDAGDAGDRAGV